MPKVIVDLPVEAGVYTEQTARGATGRWKDSDKVRFRYGLPEKIGGWVSIAGGAFIGLARRIWDWTSLDARVWSSLGTEAKLYLYQAGAYSDITPLRRQVALTDPFSTTISSDLVTVNDPAHGAQVGDYVSFTGATPVGGITIVGEYQIQSITDIDNYVIQDDQTATSTATGGGTVQAQYDISVGLSSSGFGTGWSTGAWSAETWGTPRTVSTTQLALRTWSLDNWGEDLLAVPRGGALYWWDRNTGNNARANILPDPAPVNINYMIISQRDRHVFALGCTDFFTGLFDPLLIRWCSKEDFSDWIPSSTNTAGDLRLYRGSKIQAAIRTRGEILVFTDVSVHQVNYLGGTAVYGVQTVGENVSILGPNAAIEVDYRVFFMGEADFYIYDGILRVLPCDVRNRVYDNLTVSQKEKSFAGLNREFNEIWFFYPAKEESVYWETNFALGNGEDELYQKINDGAAANYDWIFNAQGYTEYQNNVTDTLQPKPWTRSDGEALIPDKTNFEAQFTFQFKTPSSVYVPSIFLNWFNGDGTASSTRGFIVGPVTNSTTIAIYRERAADGAPAIVASVAGSTLSPPLDASSAVDDVWTVTVKRTPTQISVNIYDVTNDNFYEDALTYVLTAQDILDFASGTTGAGLWNSVDGSDNIWMTAFSAGAAGSLSANQGEQAISQEVNHYVLYNYEEKTWATGKLSRTAWADKSPVFNKPYAAGTDMVLYKHEVGANDDGAALPAFVESYDMEIPESGEHLMHVDQLIPDFLELAGNVNLTLKGKKYPQVLSYAEKGPYPVTQATRKVSTRIRARQVALRIESLGLDDDWRMGTLRARIKPHGKRA